MGDRDLRAAAAAHDADIEALAFIEEAGLRYLARADEVYDPVTDGLECDNEERG